MFAHRGARAHAPENTIESFQLALRLGATGLESDVWVTSDGIAVLDHDGEVRSGLFKKTPIGRLRRDQLPDHVPTLRQLFEICGTDYHLSLDLKDHDAGEAVLELVREVAPDLMRRLWLCHPVLDELTMLRPLDEQVKLVESTRLERIDEGLERRAARLADVGIDGINLRKPGLERWPGGVVPPVRAHGVLVGPPVRAPLAVRLPDGDRRRLQRFRRPHGRHVQNRDRFAEPLTGAVYSHCQSLFGQNTTNARPTRSSNGIVPSARLSCEPARLSPITNTWPSGTTVGVIPWPHRCRA